MDWNEFTFVHLEAAAAPQIYERGVDYFRQGHLIKACKIENVLAGVLIGTGGDYKVRLWFEQLDLQGECTCPYQGFCKHMVALAVAWLEDQTRFTDLLPQLTTVLENPLTQTKILLDLIHKDPLNFLTLYPDEATQSDFITTRGMLNLIRNTFSAPQITTDGAVLLWEKVKHMENILWAKLQANDPQATELLVELLTGFEQVVELYQSDSLRQNFGEVVQSIYQMGGTLNPTQVRPLYRKLFASYLNPNLWELAVELKAVLLSCQENDPEFFWQQVAEYLNAEPSLLILIPLYNLLTEVLTGNSLGQDYQAQVTDKLSALPDGCLWLIDRLVETAPDQAYKMAKVGSRLFPEQKAAFRERLIDIHQKRGELKQAAALSFIQFQEAPNFEEYLRLKNILSKHPTDWESYVRKIKQCVTSGGEELLGIRIIIDQRDGQGITDCWERIVMVDELLLALAEIFATEIQVSLLNIYPVLIKTLLDRGGAPYWKAALQLLVTFKRYCCYQGATQEQWELLRAELLEIYQDDFGFKKKFGTIVAG
jgi:SWIM zinc finger